jgi:ssRNA-specific RNase YbeY (16S rRNA maturation enzyme)
MIFLKLSEKERKNFRQEEKEYFIQTLGNDVNDINNKLTSKRSKYILKSLLTVEDSEFRFVNMFFWNGRDVLSFPYQTENELYLNILMGFYKSKSPKN